MEIDFSWITGILSGDELKALAWLLLTILSVVQYAVKVPLRYAIGIELSLPAIIIITLAVSVVAALVLWPVSSAVPWYIAGVCGGPLANMLFWSAGSPIRSKLPWLWRMLQAERRRNIRRPPGGLERRKGQ